MTLNDIKKEVAHLGFESESAIDGSIESAVRRALSTVYTEHGPVGTGHIYQSSPMPKMHVPLIIHDGHDEVISLDGGSYAFVISGNGQFEITDEDGVRTEAFHTPEGYVYGNVKGEGKIRFSSEFRYTVYDLCVYDQVFAEGEAPPRYAAMREYELKEYIPDFLCALSLALNSRGEIIAGSSVRSGVLRVPYEYAGEIILEYRKKAPEVSINAPDAELEIPSELEHLVALVTASYVWLDDDAEKAQYYMSLYRDGMSGVKLYTRKNVDTKFNDVTRWA